MDSFGWLFLLSMAMFIGSLIAGAIPTMFKLSNRRVNLLNAFAAGILVSTALAVIIPEGVETLYTATASSVDGGGGGGGGGRGAVSAGNHKNHKRWGLVGGGGGHTFGSSSAAPFTPRLGSIGGKSYLDRIEKYYSSLMAKPRSSSSSSSSSVTAKLVQSTTTTTTSTGNLGNIIDKQNPLDQDSQEQQQSQQNYHHHNHRHHQENVQANTGVGRGGVKGSLNIGGKPRQQQQHSSSTKRQSSKSNPYETLEELKEPRLYRRDDDSIEEPINDGTISLSSSSSLLAAESSSSSSSLSDISKSAKLPSPSALEKNSNPSSFSSLPTTITPSQQQQQPADNQHQQTDFSSPHDVIGPFLMFGFMFMFIIEHVGSWLSKQIGYSPSASSSSPNSSKHLYNRSNRNSVELDAPINDNQNISTASSFENAEEGGADNNDDKNSEASNGNIRSVTVGLVVHAAADGIAMGAASVSERSALGFIVFIAIMLHKTPSAFGLTAFLLHEGCSTRTIRSHSLLFSMSAPLSSILTYLVLAANPSDDPVTVLRWTGILLLFSAGTFLYVSTVHILPEIYSNVKSNNNHHHHRLGDQYQLQMRNPGHSTLSSPSSPSTAAGHSHDKHLSIYQFSALIFGMLVPFFISQGVSWEI